MKELARSLKVCSRCVARNIHIFLSCFFTKIIEPKFEIVTETPKLMVKHLMEKTAKAYGNSDSASHRPKRCPFRNHDPCIASWKGIQDWILNRPHCRWDSRYWNPDFCNSWIPDSNCWRNPDSLSCFPNSGFHEQKFPWFRHQRATCTLYAAINVLKFMPLKDVIYKRLIVAVVS